MAMTECTLAKWSHHEAGTAFKQAHVPIRKALEAHEGTLAVQLRGLSRRLL